MNTPTSPETARSGPNSPRGFLELGAEVKVLADRATTLSVAARQFLTHWGPARRPDCCWRSEGVGSRWFPGAPELFALPAGDLGHAAPWNLGVTAGVSWGLL